MYLEKLTRKDIEELEIRQKFRNRNLGAFRLRRYWKIYEEKK